MYTLDYPDGISMKKGMLIYLAVSLFCLLFSLVYNQFSHGVHSPFMTWLFAWPLVLGCLPCGAFLLLRALRPPKRLTVNIYNSGVAALTVSSLLRGIFEIAGTASVYQQWLMAAGVTFLTAGIIIYIWE